MDGGRRRSEEEQQRTGRRVGELQHRANERGDVGRGAGAVQVEQQPLQRRVREHALDEHDALR